MLPAGEFAGYTRRQVCYLAAKALTGARLDGSLPLKTDFNCYFLASGGYEDGLTRYLSEEGRLWSFETLAKL